MAERVMVYDGDIGEIYSDANHPEHGFPGCDEDDKCLAADAYITIKKNGWEILGEDDDGDIRVRTHPTDRMWWIGEKEQHNWVLSICVRLTGQLLLYQSYLHFGFGGMLMCSLAHEEEENDN